MSNSTDSQPEGLTDPEIFGRIPAASSHWQDGLTRNCIAAVAMWMRRKKIGCGRCSDLLIDLALDPAPLEEPYMDTLR